AAVRDTLDRTPPELAGDIMEHGLTLAGGGALLHGMAERMSEECQMPAQLAESPMTCVATGGGQALEEFDALKRAGGNSSRARRRY
ncbi:MAG: rod shape-determining protein, partial [Solirubrobacterales bacterium]